MIRSVTVVVLILLLTALPPTLAVNPLDNDAGSGRDAGDGFDDAILIEPGDHTGRLTFPIDITDTYAVDIEAGQRLGFQLDDPYLTAWVYDPDRRLAGTFSTDGDSDDRPIPRTGTWYIRLEAYSPLNETGVSLPRVYAFSLSLETPVTSITSWGNATWITREVTWDEAASVEAWNEVFVHEGSPEVYTLISMTEATIQPRWGPPFIFGIIMVFTEEGFAHRVEVRPGPVGNVNLPEQITDIVDSEGGSLWTAVYSRFPNTLGGTMRQTVVFIGDGNSVADIGLSFSATNMTESWAEESGDAGRVVWNNTNTNAEMKILTPAAAVIGDRSLHLDLDRRFVGWFDPGNARNATVHHPDGRTSHGSGLFLWPEPGTWSFELAPSVDGYGETARQYLAGAFIPELGLVPR